MKATSSARPSAIFPLKPPAFQVKNGPVRGRTVDDVMFQKWSDLLRAWAVDPIQARPAFDEVSYRYSEPGRFYHTSDHVQAVLGTVESLGSSAQNLNAVKLAVWLHDVIYDSKASDNEERSAVIGDNHPSTSATIRIPAR
ncbi:MAG: hypothetical protein WCL32_25610, partial [Planctomycetota bacterium]